MRSAKNRIGKSRMSLTFIHAADLHLDSPLRGLAAYEDAPIDRLRSASRHAFSQLIDTAIDRAVAFLVLAGDIWDGEWPDIRTGLYFASEMGRLNRARIRVFMIRGNHDAESRLTSSITFPENVYVFASDRAETVIVDDLKIAIHGQSFSRPDVTDNIALSYPDAEPGHINIGMLHTALEGDANHASYAPCRLTDLQSKGYDYWALGHVHRHAILAGGRTGADGGTIAFPGVLQGRHVRETGAKGALFIEIDDDGVRVDRLLVDVVRWFDVKVDVSGTASFEDVARKIGTALQNLALEDEAPLGDRLLAMRLSLVGHTAIHGLLSTERQQLRSEALGQVAAIGRDKIFLEKIRVETSSSLSAEEIEHRQDALADLQRILEAASTDGPFIEATTAELRDMLSLLPPDVRTALEETEPDSTGAIRDDRLDVLFSDVCTSLIDHLAKV